MSPFVEKLVGPDLMVYDPGQDAVHILNPAAQLVLKCRREGKDEAAIGAAMRAEFQLPLDHPVLEEVRESLRNLAAIGLV